jgi:hypothetical protein
MDIFETVINTTVLSGLENKTTIKSILNDFFEKEVVNILNSPKGGDTCKNN